MKTIEIKGSLRTETGKKSTKKLRESGNIPCIIYGKEKNIHFYTHENSFTNLIYTPESHIVRFNLDDKIFRLYLKDIQFHPVTDKIIHADFMEIFDDKPVKISLPVKISGDSAGVKAGGKLRIKRRHLNVKGFVNDIPEFLNIDITNLKVNQSIKVGDLAFGKIELTDPKIATVLSVATSRVTQKSETEESPEKPAPETEVSSAAETPAEGKNK